MSNPVIFLLFSIICLLCISYGYADDLIEDRLTEFYTRLNQSDVLYCPDRGMLLPDCKECIPGLVRAPGSLVCDKLIPSAQNIRNEIANLVLERFGQLPPERKYGLYPYLEKGEFLNRQKLFGQMLEKNQKMQTIMDIGAYYNPIHLFMPQLLELCPANILIVEPILEPLSAKIPCKDASKYIHVIILPITFRYYISIRNMLPMPDTVVCIGCDSHYGPTRKMLETTFDRPYTLFLEFPAAYKPDIPFHRLGTNSEQEKLIFENTFDFSSKETQFTKRWMKVIVFN